MSYQRSFQQTQRLFDSPKTVPTITNPVPLVETQPVEITTFDLPVTESVSISTETTKSIDTTISPNTGSIPITKVTTKNNG